MKGTGQDGAGHDAVQDISPPALMLTQHGGDLGEGLLGLAGDERVSIGAEVPFSAVKVNGHLRLALRGRVRHNLQRLPSGHQGHLFTPSVGPIVDSLSNVPDIIFTTFILWNSDI